MRTPGWKRLFSLLILTTMTALPVKALAFGPGFGELIALPVYLCYPNTKLFPASTESETSWSYVTSAYGNGTVPAGLSANIRPFIDKRVEKHSNLIFLADIPVLPFGSVSSTKPENATKHLLTANWKFDPVNDFPKALLAELTEARILRRVSLGEEGMSDLVITGEIIDTTYRGKVYSYGLTTVGKVLWLIGLPMISYSENLILTLHCVDTRTNRVLVSKTYTPAEESRVEWIYTATSDKNEILYPALLKAVYAEFIEDLKKALSEERSPAPAAADTNKP